MPEDQGLNKYLSDTYGTAFDGQPLFRLIWSTNVTEKRYAEFNDFYEDIYIRTVREVRDCLKYPFAQDRWVLERLAPITDNMRLAGLVDGNFSYEEIYIFQDKEGNHLPLNRSVLEMAMYYFFKAFAKMSWKDRADLQMAALAERELKKKEQTRAVVEDDDNAI